MNLLTLVLLIWWAGGMSWAVWLLCGIFICLALVIFSWLYAPFIFNPYQFRPQFFYSDLRAWCAFFFKANGVHWMEWYKKDQMKPRRGFAATVLDLNFLLAFFWIVLWLAVLNAKIVTVLHVLPRWHLWYIGALLPPVVFSTAFCCGVVLIEELVGAGRSMRGASPGWSCGNLCRISSRRRGSKDSRDMSDAESAATNRFQEFGGSTSTASEGSSGSDESNDEDESQSTWRRHRCCASGAPLAIVAVGCLAATAAELYPLTILRTIGWRKAFITALLYKAFWVHFLRQFCVALVRSKCFPRLGAWGRPVELWLLAFSMLRDMWASAFIFWTLSPLVALSAISQWVCPTWSFHHLLVYRQPGHTARENVEVLVYHDSGTGEQSGLDDESSFDGSHDGSSDTEAESNPSPRPTVTSRI
uniref:Uncharacterized protein n=1 Tax=Zooxanthella nutricula TaxID=1333877 RepID=A0A7S2Q7J2_9DINO